MQTRATGGAYGGISVWKIARLGKDSPIDFNLAMTTTLGEYWSAMIFEKLITSFLVSPTNTISVGFAR